jgi:hypothetical protein
MVFFLLLSLCSGLPAQVEEVRDFHATGTASQMLSALSTPSSSLAAEPQIRDRIVTIQVGEATRSELLDAVALTLGGKWAKSRDGLMLRAIEPRAQEPITAFRDLGSRMKVPTLEEVNTNVSRQSPRSTLAEIVQGFEPAELLSMEIGSRGVYTRAPNSYQSHLKPKHVDACARYVASRRAQVGDALASTGVADPFDLLWREEATPEPMLIITRKGLEEWEWRLGFVMPNGAIISRAEILSRPGSPYAPQIPARLEEEAVRPLPDTALGMSSLIHRLVTRGSRSLESSLPNFLTRQNEPLGWHVAEQLRLWALRNRRNLVAWLPDSTFRHTYELTASINKPENYLRELLKSDALELRQLGTFTILKPEPRSGPMANTSRAVLDGCLNDVRSFGYCSLASKLKWAEASPSRVDFTFENIIVLLSGGAAMMCSDQTEYDVLRFLSALNPQDLQSVLAGGTHSLSAVSQGARQRLRTALSRMVLYHWTRPKELSLTKLEVQIGSTHLEPTNVFQQMDWRVAQMKTTRLSKAVLVPTRAGRFLRALEVEHLSKDPAIDKLSQKFVIGSLESLELAFNVNEHLTFRTHLHWIEPRSKPLSWSELPESIRQGSEAQRH